jgi:hypothetical protein
MLSRRAFAAILTAGAIGTSVRLAGATGKGPRAGEADTLRRFVEQTHPRGLFATTQLDWRSRWDKLAADADQLSDSMYLVQTRRALAWLEDGHTTVLPFEFTGGVPQPLVRGPLSLELPMRVKVFHDGVRVVTAGAEALPLLGAEIRRIGAFDVRELMRAHSAAWPGGAAWAHRWSSIVFTSPALLNALGAVADPGLKIDIEALDAQRRTRHHTLAPRAQATEQSRQIARTPADTDNWRRAAGVGNYVHLVRERKALYVAIDETDNVAGKTFEAFTAEISVALDGPDIERLIIDLRRNGGGDNFLPETLRKLIARSRFNRPGGLYVLTSPMTFSAGQNLATRLERETYALFAGEPTGGRPNQYGDPAVFVGEATGLTSIVSTVPWFDSYPADKRSWIQPDLPAPETFADWCAGRDAALTLALEHSVATTARDADAERSYFFKRESQQAAWQPFWRS